MRNLVNKLLPIGSRRRKIIKLTGKTLKHPIKSIKALSPKHIKTLCKELKNKDLDLLERQFNIAVLGINGEPEKVKLVKSIKKSKIKDYKKLEFKVYDDPLVSIIIPVYNQFDYTYNCLKSILENTIDDISYEIIIGDDCSLDLTKDISKIVKGIKVIRNKTNLKFLLNCNNAASYAKGKYILFLNNDTQVQEHFLKPLIDLIESREDIGMVGSQLLYPDGLLQEAGGIVFKDASAWNYGNKQSPNAAEYNYVKEVDYISGASIMIKRDLWNEIGGFDTRFAPSYYEDTDLAFEVRKHGFKVMYQPLSKVVHFEGVSNGTDVNSGLKSYQVENGKKFYLKWKDVLEKEHFDNGQNIYLAKDRGQFKKQILVIDHYVPNYDKDAGGKCTYMYIKMFLQKGMKVTFIGDNYFKHEPYSTKLNQLGVEILYGNYYYLNYEEWLKNNLKYFDYVYLQRPHISIKYIDIVKKYCKGKIFYFAHDLHHIRLYRDYLLNHNEDTLNESKHWEKIEMKLFSMADVGHVVGSYEQKIMQDKFPNKPIRNIPLYIYDELPKVEKDFTKRKDIMFVGGFQHAPNEDGVLWFSKNVFNKIVEKIPDIKWHIVGSKVSLPIKALASKNIIIDGFLSDEELQKLYNSCKISIVPLRFGAGVKGKIVEAAYYQIPVVTTSIGEEGIDSSIGAFKVEDDPDKMAKLIIDLYNDIDTLTKMSDNGKKLIEKYYTQKSAIEVLSKDIDFD